MVRRVDQECLELLDHLASLVQEDNLGSMEALALLDQKE